MPFVPSLDETLKVMNSKGYLLYNGRSGKRRGLNIVGIRSATDSPDRFDDVILVFYLVPGSVDFMAFAITTDPSPYYLKRPVNPKGTAILMEGQYVDKYAISMHSPPSGNKHLALCQRLGNVTVFRDNTRDGKLNYVSPESGIFGINIHRGPQNGTWETTNSNYSAGCQVFSDEDDFNLFLARCKKERADTEQEKFTYTLLNEKDFN